MSQPSPPPNVDRLFARLLEEDLQPAEMECLNEALRQDASLRELYRKYMIVDALLRWEVAPPLMQLGGEEKPEIGNPKSEVADLPSALHLPPSVFPPIIVDLSSTPHSPLAALRASLGGFLLAYVVATVVLGLAIVTASWIKISNSSQIVRSGQKPSVSPKARAPRVGRISALVNCRWAGAATRVSPGDDVRLGQEIALLSGCLEVAYDTGANVILQGPVTYEVESARGGFLSVGKLTARVEAGGGGRGTGDGQVAKSEIRNLKSEGSHPSSFILHPSSLFSVRTPTAIVTDLGTEFGIEVEESGTTHSHVFEGKVELSPRDRGRERGNVIALERGESAVAVMGAGRRVRITRGDDPSSPIVFVRRARDGGPFESWVISGMRRWRVIARGDDAEIQWQVRVPYDGPADRPAQSGAEQPPTAGERTAARPVLQRGDRDGRRASSGCITCKFRLAGELPEKAILWAQFTENKGLDQVRLNGEIIGTPLLSPPGRRKLVILTRSRDIGNLLRKGSNTLEFDITRHRSVDQDDMERFRPRDPREGAKGSR